MEVKSVQTALLCNQEVLSLLNKLKEDPQEQNVTSNSNLATIYYETSHFLQDSGFGEQTTDRLKQVLTSLGEFPVALTKQEMLMMIHYPPETNLQLSLIVRDADERMTEQQMQALLSLMVEKKEDS